MQLIWFDDLDVMKQNRQAVNLTLFVYVVSNNLCLFKCQYQRYFLV